ncbi:hypothetical protein D3C79_398860 [compost metagenome]
MNSWWQHADRTVINNRAVVDGVELAGFVLNAFELELVPLWPRDVADIELHELQVIEVQNPATFHLRLFAEVRHDRDLAASHGTHLAGLGLAAGQVNQQTRPCRHLDVTVDRHDAARHGGNTPTIAAARQHRVGQGDHLARLRDVAIQAHPEAGTAQLQLLRHQRPLPGALGLTPGRAPDRLHRDLAHPVLGDGIFIEDRFFIGVVAAIRVIERHHGLAVPLAQLAADVLDRAVVEDLRQRVVVHRVLRHIGVDGDLAAVPEGQAMEDGGQVLQHCPGLGLLLQVQVAGEARLLATLPVRHHLVAVLADSVERPAVDHTRIDAVAKAVVRVQGQVVEHPGRVVGVGLLEGTVPNTVGGAGAAGGIGAGLRVVVHGHPHDPPTHQNGDLGDVTAELLGVVLHATDSRKRVFLVAVDHLGDGFDVHSVLYQRAVGLGRDAACPNRPARTSR